MDELEVLRDVAHRLGQTNVPYMLTGSLAMSYYAEPRMTRDIDLVVEMRETDAGPIIRRFQDDYYISAQSVRDAIRNRSMFNLIHTDSLIKIDFVVRRDTPFRRTEFERRRKHRIGALEIFLVSKEDLIISKIDWAKDSRSEVQQRDVRSLLATGYDREYVEHWLQELGLEAFAEGWLT